MLNKRSYNSSGQNNMNKGEPPLKKPSGTSQIRGHIAKIIEPENTGDFTGWCRIALIDPDSHITYIMQGNLPCLDPAFLFSVEYRKTTERFYQKRKGIKRNSAHATHDTVLEITKLVKMEKRPLTLILLEELLVRFTGMSSNAASRHVSNIPADELNTESLRKYTWFDLVEKRTLFFLPDDLIMVASYFDMNSMTKIMKSPQERLQQILTMARTVPQNLCARSLHKLGHGIGEMSLDGLDYCIKTFKLGRLEPSVHAALKFYKGELRNILEASGHSYLSRQELLKFSISKSAAQFIATNGLLISEKGKYYIQQAVLERNEICDAIRGIIQRGNSDGAPFRALRGGKLPKFETRFSNLICADGNKLDPTQSEAVKLTFKCPIVCIDGAPGTGKTSKVANMIISLHNPHNILAVSATGNAAKQFSEQTGKECLTIDRAIVMIRRTLRRIQYNSSLPSGAKKKKLDNRIHTSTTLIIDEASMADETKLGILLGLLPYLCQLILLGDCNQGKPFGRGLPFADIKRMYPTCTIRLETNYRVDSASKSLITLCKSVLDRNLKFTCTMNRLETIFPCVFMNRSSPSEGGLISDLEKVFSYHPISDHHKIQVITHTNKTTSNVNSWYWNRYTYNPQIHGSIPRNSRQKIFVVGQRVVITENGEEVNNYRTGARSDSIKNGEVSIIVSIVDEKYTVLLSTQKKNESKSQSSILKVNENSSSTETIDGVRVSALNRLDDFDILDQDDDDDDSDSDSESDTDESDGDDCDPTEMGDSISAPKSQKKKRIREPEHIIQQESTYADLASNYRRIVTLANGKRIDLNEVGLRRLEHATCLTIAKSQGKEFPIVIFVIEPNEKTGDISKHLTSDWLYVALSRARVQVIVICDLTKRYPDHMLGEHSKTHSMGEFGKVVLLHLPTPINSDLDDYLPPLN